jgi:hypothetical protein
MRVLFSILLLISLPSWAGLNRLAVSNLDLDYEAGAGQGVLEKIQVAIKGTAQGPWPVEVEKVEQGLILRTPMLEFTWEEPWGIFLSMQKLLTRGFSLDVGRSKHTLSARQLRATLPVGLFTIDQLKASCTGTSEDPEIGRRLMDDCRAGMLAEAYRVELPVDFFVRRILDELPEQSAEADQPVFDFYLATERGDFYLYFLARYWVRAGLRSWGHVSFERDHKTMVIRLDRVRFGILTVTSIVWRELRKIQHPSVEVSPPFIRIKLEE